MHFHTPSILSHCFNGFFVTDEVYVQRLPLHSYILSSSESLYLSRAFKPHGNRHKRLQNRQNSMTLSRSDRDSKETFRLETFFNELNILLHFLHLVHLHMINQNVPSKILMLQEIFFNKLAILLRKLENTQKIG